MGGSQKKSDLQYAKCAGRKITDSDANGIICEERIMTYLGLETQSLVLRT